MTAQIIEAGTKDHPITIEKARHRTKVSWKGVVIANSERALDLKETTYPAVKYIPRSDVDMRLLKRTSHTSHCPYKGDASYYTIKADGKTLDNAIWTYETPFPAMTEITGHLAFYPDKVKIEEVG